MISSIGDARRVRQLDRVLEINGNDANDERLKVFERRTAEIEAQYERPQSLKLATHMLRN
ncbi:hypothetical protein BGLA2_780036 [Burkholderia gladioli]|nr:hypothetical protein BGLA2_780036 [Burkholderia gladioli]